MHHKHKRTVQKELKRYDHKSARAKERAALEGGHPGQARSMFWSNSIPQPPIIDEVGQHKKVKKKKHPPKDRCPVNGTHEWYREKVTQTVYSMYFSLPREVEYDLRTCIHCWVEKKKLRRNRPAYRTGGKRPYKPRMAYRKPSK